MAREFRPAREEDAERLLDLTLRAYAPTLKMGINFAAATADLDYVLKHLHNNVCYILEEDGKILATCSLRMPWGLQPGPCGVPHICWLAVEPEVGGSGVGSVMLKWIEETIVRDTLKAPAVTLGTAEEHPWLVKMYEKRGYVRVGTANLGRGHTTIYLRKILLPQMFEELNENNILKNKHM